MGLDTTHGCWHGAYSAFMRWRDKLAEVSGIPLRKMQGFCDADEDAVPWSALKPDPLHVLLDHSDCDGEIAAKDCGPLADRLEELLPLLDGDGGGHIGSYKEKTQQFIDGLHLAASLGEPVEFH